MNFEGIIGEAISFFLSIVAVLALLLSATFFLECLAAQLPQPTKRQKLLPRPRVAVLVPAHNEAAGIRATIAALKLQIGNGDRLLVVADNCDDDTAAVARASGAMVVERQNPQLRGKGYALDFGLQILADDPPDVVAIVDADCWIAPGAIGKISRQAAATGRPVQAQYVLDKPAVPNTKDAVSAFAFRVKNLVRPQGLARFGLPCLLTGTGMAFPWEEIASINLASGNIVEDMKLGIDLACAGYPPTFCPSALVVGRLPDRQKTAKTQRTRWEHGHLQSLLTHTPRLVLEGFRQRRFELLTLALELGVPPLSLFALMLLGLSAVAGLVGWMAGIWLPLIILGVSGGLLAIAVAISWWKFGRQDISLLKLLSIPAYMAWKIPLYIKFLVSPEKRWIRTERFSES